MKTIYVTDKKRHLVCVPYSIENLHQMAEELKIKRCWFHKNHYDIPKGRVDEVEKKCHIISPKEIVEIIKSPEYAQFIIMDELPKTMKNPNNQVLPEREVLKYNGFIKEKR